MQSAPLRHAREEIDAAEARAVADAGFGEITLRAGADQFDIADFALKRGMGAQDFDQHRAVAAADISDKVKP